MLSPPESLDYEGEKVCVCLRLAEANFYEIFLLVILCWSLGLHASLSASIKQRNQREKTRDNKSEYLILMLPFLGVYEELLQTRYLNHILSFIKITEAVEVLTIALVSPCYKKDYM